MNQEKREVLTASELSKLFGVNKKTIYQNAKRGNIPVIRLGRRLFFPKRAIFNWLKTTKFPKISSYHLKKFAPVKNPNTSLPLPFQPGDIFLTTA